MGPQPNVPLASWSTIFKKDQTGSQDFIIVAQSLKQKLSKSLFNLKVTLLHFFLKGFQPTCYCANSLGTNGAIFPNNTGGLLL